MARREGNIRQRPDGTYEARYVTASGHRASIYAKTLRGEQGAQQRLRKALDDAEQGVAPVGLRLTVAAFLDDWLATSVQPRLRPATVASYESTVRQHIIPAIGRVRLAKLTPEDVARMLAGLPDGLSPSSRRYVYTVLRIALGRALKQGRVGRNVATLIDPPKISRRELIPPTLDEVGTFLASVTDDRLGPLYTVAIGLGLRQGELLGLRWSDVNGDSLTVRQQLSSRTGLVAEPKTERSRRTLRLGAVVAETLRQQRQMQREDRLRAGSRWQDTGLVFTTATGTALDGANVTHRFQAALGRAGLRRWRFHDLRHASATLRLEQGEDLATVSRILGHASITTTANVYGHLTDAMLDRDAERMDSILRKANA